MAAPRSTKAISRPKSAPTGPGSDDEFTYTTRSGDTITVASLSVALNAGEIRKLRREDPAEWAFYVIERDCSPEELAVFDAMTSDELSNDFMPKWQEHSGVGPGESKAS